MIQLITPGSFIRNSPYLKESFIRISPHRGEIIISSALLELLEFQKGDRVQFALKAEDRDFYILKCSNSNGYSVSLNSGRGRIYSVPLIQLIERILDTKIVDPISIPIECIPLKIYGSNLYKLFTEPLKQRETASEERNPITIYKNKAYTKKGILALLRAYWDRSYTSKHKATRDRNMRNYERVKKHCENQELDIDFPLIESKFT